MGIHDHNDVKGTQLLGGINGFKARRMQVCSAAYKRDRNSNCQVQFEGGRTPDSYSFAAAGVTREVEKNSWKKLASMSAEEILEALIVDASNRTLAANVASQRRLVTSDTSG